jgi:hypothetical protein
MTLDWATVSEQRMGPVTIQTRRAYVPDGVAGWLYQMLVITESDAGPPSITAQMTFVPH